MKIRTVLFVLIIVVLLVLATAVLARNIDESEIVPPPSNGYVAPTIETFDAYPSPPTAVPVFPTAEIKEPKKPRGTPVPGAQPKGDVLR